MTHETSATTGTKNGARPLRRKLDAPTLKINFSRLRAADIQGRSRAYAGMVGAGLAPDKAAEIAGLAED